MKRMKWVFALGTTILAAVVILAISSPKLAVRADDKPAAEVTIEKFSFGPDITVAPGSTVTWTNHDNAPHTVSSDTDMFKSKNLANGDHFSYTFTKPGTYPYHCSIHQKMVAKVIVQ